MSLASIVKNFDFGTRSEIERGASEGLRFSLRVINRINKQNHNYKDRTGTLTASHGFEVRGLSGRLYNSAYYSSWVHDGTKAHWIAPVKAKALSWVQGGQRRFSKGHMVSGITPRLWMQKNIDDNLENMEHNILRSMDKYIIKGHS